MHAIICILDKVSSVLSLFIIGGVIVNHGGGPEEHFDAVVLKELNLCHTRRKKRRSQYNSLIVRPTISDGFGYFFSSKTKSLYPVDQPESISTAPT